MKGACRAGWLMPCIVNQGGNRHFAGKPAQAVTVY